jgi:uncharacterized protein YndB with AHSA1/START domain
MNDAVRVSIDVPVDPARAFRVFTEEIDLWWRRGPRFRHVGPSDGVIRLEPGVGGRLLQVHDEDPARTFAFGEVRVWRPAERLVFTWRVANFAPTESTEVEVIFQPTTGGGTQVQVIHRGWAAIRSDHPARHGHQGHAFVMHLGGWWRDQLGMLRRLSEFRETRSEDPHPPRSDEP